MNTNNVTIVTGLWDLERGSIEGWGKRSFDDYKKRFFDLLKCDNAMVIYIPSFLREEVETIRQDKKTYIIIKENKDFESWNPFFSEIEKIRNSPDWIHYAGWLSGSPQAELKHYNAMMFTKTFMVNDASIINPFGHDYFFWLDGGITNTVNAGYFTKDRVLDKLPDYLNSTGKDFIHITYPYTANNEIHGFTRDGMNKYCQTDSVGYVARGGFFGGSKKTISEINGAYYNVMRDTLNDGFMGADECLFTILCHTHESLIHRFDISGNGLVFPFFEHLKSFDVNSPKSLAVEPSNFKPPLNHSSPKGSESTSLYILTYNSPEQLFTLIKSFDQVPNFLNSFSYKIILDNSTKEDVFNENKDIAIKNGFELIKKDNLGICGGRQFIAEHFENSNSDYMIFFEDDMFLNPPSEKGYCKNGFRKYIDNIVSKSLKIMVKNKLDFLKWSFTEFFGDNKTQWSWYNVPQKVRETHWPDYHKLPEHGLDPNAPLVHYNSINIEEDLTYATGNCYYCNWPVMVSKAGNQKMFLKTKWARPYEQTWMSHIFQETVAGNIKSAILLASPITHDRFVHYAAGERKES